MDDALRATAPDGVPFDVLYERAALPRFDVPATIAATYGGIGFDGATVFANFVASVDGVVALHERAESGRVISRASQADRFVMGLLRACADTLIVGAGTFRKASNARFTAESIYPAAATEFAEMRSRLGLSAVPRLVVITASGAIDTSGPSMAHATIVTTPSGEAALRPRVPATTRVVALPTAPIRVVEVLSLLRAEGARFILTEGGPSLFGEFVEQRLVDELFVTTSPVLFGRFDADRRKSLADGRDLGGAELELLSQRRHGSYTFSRYALRK